MKHAWLIVLLLCGASQADSEKVWECGPLKGTAHQLGEKINAEVVRVFKNVRLDEQDIAEADAAAKAEHDACLARVHSSENFKRYKAHADEVEPRLEAARKAHAGADAISLSSQLNKARAAMARLERDALIGDVALHVHERDADRYSADLAQQQEVMEKAVAWRDEIVGASRNSYHLQWPPVVGDLGILGEVTPKDVDKDGFTANYRVIEWGEKEHEQEKLVTHQVLMHPVFLIVNGFDTTSLAPGKLAVIDRTFVIKDVRAIGLDLAVIVQRRPHELDEYFKQIDAKPERTEKP